MAPRLQPAPGGRSSTRVGLWSVEYLSGSGGRASTRMCVVVGGVPEWVWWSSEYPNVCGGRWSTGVGLVVGGVSEWVWWWSAWAWPGWSYAGPPRRAAINQIDQTKRWGGSRPLPGKLGDRPAALVE